MKTSQKVALLIGVVTIVAGGGLGYAQMEGPQPPDGPMQGLMRGHDRLADRLLHNFDLNRDGRVSHDEMNRTIGARFAAATRHAPKMTADQFAALHMGEYRQHNAEMFRRIDWNADGKVTLEDFGGPQRARFMVMDRQGSGTVSCAPNPGFRSERAPLRARTGRSTGSYGSFGLSGFCADNDLNMDGKVTRVELDGAIAKRFTQATGGASIMNAGQFFDSGLERFTGSNERTFRRLDRDRDRALTLAEFAASELKLFARLDKNRDGILTAEEMRPQFRRTVDRSKGRRSYD